MLKIKLFHLISEIQTRGFKTKRLIEAEENANRGFIPHFRKIKKSIEQRTATENMSALLKSNKYRGKFLGGMKISNIF